MCCRMWGVDCEITLRLNVTNSHYAKIIMEQLRKLPCVFFQRENFAKNGEEPKYASWRNSLSRWYQSWLDADWNNFADVRKTFSSADRFEKKTIFNVHGNACRIIAIIDFQLKRVFIRAVLDHKEYDRGEWKKDTFGDDWGLIVFDE